MAVSQQCSQLVLLTVLLFSAFIWWFGRVQVSPSDAAPDSHNIPHPGLAPPGTALIPVKQRSASKPTTPLLLVSQENHKLDEDKLASDAAVSAKGSTSVSEKAAIEIPKDEKGQHDADDNMDKDDEEQQEEEPSVKEKGRLRSKIDDHIEDEDLEDVRPPGSPVPPDHVTWKVPSSSEALPPRELAEHSAWKRRSQTVAAEDPRATLYSLNDILDNQFPPNCRDRNFLVFSISTSATYGFFSLMNQMIGALSAALYLNRTLVFVTRRDYTWMYTERQECLDSQGTYQAWNCFFQPITHCSIPKSQMQYYGMTKITGSARLMEWTKGATSRLQHIVADIVYGRKVFAQLAQNPPIESREFVRHTALLSSFLFRPVQAVVDYKNALKDWLGLSKVPSYVAVHVRRTDKEEEAWLFNTGDWTKLAQQYAVKYGKHVFVMTDDPTAYAQMQGNADAKAAGLHFYSSPQLRPKRGATPTILRSRAQHHNAANGTSRRGRFSITRHGVEFLADCLIAAEASFFIGSCGSNVDWVIPQLIAVASGNYEVNGTSHLLLQKTCRYWALEWANDHSYWSNIGKDELRLADIREIFLRDLLLKSDIKKLLRHFTTSSGSPQNSTGADPRNRLISAIQAYANATQSTAADELDRVLPIKQEINKWLCWMRPKSLQVECKAAGLERYHQCGLLYFGRHPSFKKEGCQGIARLPYRPPPRPKNTTATFERRLADYRAHKENLDMCINTPHKRMTNRQKVVCVKYKTKEGHWVELKPVA